MILPDLLTPEIITSVASAALGGVGIKIVDKIAARRSGFVDDNLKMRGELRTQITTLTDELKATRTSVDEWRTKYWVTYEDNAILKTQITALNGHIEQLQADIKHLVSEVERIKLELNSSS